MMGWNKDGSTVRAMYLGEYYCTGVVEESRVSYGGEVLYTLKLNDSLALPFNGELRETVIVNEKQILMDYGVIQNA